MIRRRAALVGLAFALVFAVGGCGSAGHRQGVTPGAGQRAAEIATKPA